MSQPVLPGMDEPLAPAKPVSGVAVDPDEFDWFEDEAVIVERQRSVAVYRNRRNHVVIRAEANDFDAEDKCIVLATPEALRQLVAALQRELGDW
jgi:hypothetical protein